MCSATSVFFIRLVAVLLLSALLLWTFDRRKIILSAVDGAAACFFAWYLFCYYINRNIAVSTLLEFCFLAFAYLSFRVLFSSCRYAGIWLFAVLCLCGSIEAVIGIKQALGMHRSEHHLFRITGTFFNPGPYSGYIVTIFAVVFGYIAMRYRYAPNLFVRFKGLKNISLRRALWILFFIAAVVTASTILVILPSTMSRAAFVAAMAAVTLFFFGERKAFSYTIDYFRRYRRKCIIIGIALLTLLCGGVYGILEAVSDKKPLCIRIDHTVDLCFFLLPFQHPAIKSVVGFIFGLDRVSES